MKRGLLYHLLAKGAYILSALLLHAVLARWLSMADYGLLSVVITVITFNYLFVNNGVRQALSIALARQENDRVSLLKLAIAVQVAVALFLTLVNWLAAPYVAQFLGDERLARLLSMAAFIIPFTALYFVFLGGLNGAKLFKTESLVMSVYAVLRLLPLLFLLFLPKLESIEAVILAFILGALITSIVGFHSLSALWSKAEEKKPAVSLWGFTQKSINLCLFYMGTTILMSMGVLFIKGMMADDKSVGLFSAALTLSRPVYFFSVALTAVAIPCVAASFHKGDKKETKEQFLFGLALLLIIVAPLLITLGASGPHLLSTLFPARYLSAAPTFSLLLASVFFLSLMMYANSILHAISEGSVRKVELLVVPLALLLHFLLIPSMGIMGAALAFMLAALIGAAYTVVVAAKRLDTLPTKNEISRTVALNLTVLATALLLTGLLPKGGWINLITMVSLQFIVHASAAAYLGFVDFRELWEKHVQPRFYSSSLAVEGKGNL